MPHAHRRPRVRNTLAALAASAAITLASGPSVRVDAMPPSSASGAPWEAYADPAEAGFSVAALDEARALAESSRSGAVVAIYRGRVVAAWGAVDRPFMAHSIRKSLAGALYGQAVAAGTLSLDATLATLGIDDEPPLTTAEKGARVGDLMASRSGVYHAAAYAAADQDSARPPRGSHPPGTFWFYNNWDFNALETIYEKVTGLDIYEAFARKIAAPLGMEDFTTAGQLRVLEPSQSHIPAHTFRISARDMARFGQLYLQDGRWNGTQIVPRDWVADSLRPHSDLGDGTGYGYLWWTYAGSSLGADRYPALHGRDVVMTRGTGGQALFLIPSADLVIVHRADTDNGRSVPGPAIWKIVDLIVGARTGTAIANPRLQPMRAVPLASQASAPKTPKTIALDAGALERFAGEYVIPKGGVVRVFVYGRRLFVNVPDQGEGELFATGPATFIVPVAPGASVRFTDGPDGRVVRMTLTLGPQVIEAERR